MNSSSHTRRAVAEINFGEGQAATFQIGNRSIHQFWHLFSAHFRHVLLAPQRRPDSGRVAWTWREEPESRPVTAIELAEVRRRLSEASRSLNGGFSDRDRDDDDRTDSAAALETQVRANVTALVGQLIAQRDSALARFVCRTDAGLMLHSWGGNVAAEPYYPDANHGEITGMLIAGPARPAGVSVVLETAQGSLVTRVQSESDGSFHFPNIAPGNYRVRVGDRSDFSSEGLLITMERESITGLELRGVAAATAQEPDGPSFPVSDKPHWYQRRSTLVLSLLLIVGVGSCVWSSVRTSPGKRAVEPVSTGWQAASGQLAGGKSTDAPSDNHKVGTNNAWSSLTAPRASKSTPPHEPHRSSAANATRKRAPSEASNSALTGASLPEGQPFTSDSLEKGKLRSPSSHKAAAGASHSSERPVEASSASNESELSDESDSAAPVAGKLSESQPGARGKKRQVSSGVSLPSVDEESANGDGSAGSNPLAEGGTSSTGANERKVVHPANSKRAVANSSPAAAASAEQADANPEVQSSAAGRTDASAIDQLKPSPEKNAKERSGNVSAKLSGAESTDSSTAVVGTEGEADSDRKESTSEKKGTPAPIQKKSNTSSAQVQPDLLSQSTAENADDLSALPVTATAQKRQPLKAPSATVSPAPLKANPTAETGDSPPETETAALDSTQRPSGPVNDSSAKKTGKLPEKTPSIALENPGDEPQSQEAAVALATGAASVSVARGNESGSLVRVGRVRPSAWETRIVQDSILPTHPVTESEEEAEDALRTKVLQERAAKMPETFREGRVTNGFVVEFHAALAAAGGLPRWRDESGSEPINATVLGDQAELSWSAHSILRAGKFILGYADGREIARVSVDGAGVPTLRVSPGIRARYWIGIEHAAADRAVTNPSSRTKFVWRRLSGSPMPSSWTVNENWLGGKGQRVDIPLGSSGIGTGEYGIALVDEATGWAMASNVTLE